MRFKTIIKGRALKASNPKQGNLFLNTYTNILLTRLNN